MTMTKKLRAGDVVTHRPSGETWVLATDEEDGRVYPCGWPETMANATDCDWTGRAPADDRITMLRQAAGVRDEGSVRRAVARRQLRRHTETLAEVLRAANAIVDLQMKMEEEEGQ